MAAGAGYPAPQATSALTERIPETASAVEHSQRARANTLGQRRFEKDLFLNVGNPEKEADYAAKWSEQHGKLLAEQLQREAGVAAPGFCSGRRNLAHLQHVLRRHAQHRGDGGAVGRLDALGADGTGAQHAGLELRHRRQSRPAFRRD